MVLQPLKLTITMGYLTLWNTSSSWEVRTIRTRYIQTCVTVLPYITNSHERESFRNLTQDHKILIHAKIECLPS